MGSQEHKTLDAQLIMRLVEIPLLSPFTTSFGTEHTRTALTFEYIRDSIHAFSECVTSTAPLYSYEDNSTALHVIKRHLVDMIKDEPFPADFVERSRRIKGHNMAKAALEMLLWDLKAKERGVPLHTLFGNSRGFAEVGISIGMAPINEMIPNVEAALQRGYKRIKVKIEKGREYEIISSIRNRFPGIPLSADANSCYRLSDSDTLKRLDKFDLLYLEQPLQEDDILDHSRLAKLIATPICLDESITSFERARQALETGAANVINIKPGRLGGLHESLRVIRLAREMGAHVWVGGMLETGIGRSFNVSLASNNLVDYPGDTSPNDKYFERDIVLNPFKMVNGEIKPNTGPGIGVEIDREFMEERTRKSAKIL
jgi:O-succinylbenzoate synthase